MNGAFARSSFSPTEREIIQITVSVEKQGGYCVAGHTAFADDQSIDNGVIEAIRNKQAVPNPRYQALRHFTQELVRQAGNMR